MKERRIKKGWTVGRKERKEKKKNGRKERKKGRKKERRWKEVREKKKRRKNSFIVASRSLLLSLCILVSGMKDGK